MLECDQKFQKKTVYFEPLSAHHLSTEGNMDAGTCSEVSETSYFVLTKHQLLLSNVLKETNAFLLRVTYKYALCHFS